MLCCNTRAGNLRRELPNHSSPSTQPSLSTRNSILNSLPKEDFERLLPDLEEVNLALGQVLYQAEDPITHVYFPNKAMISVIANTVGGQCAEVGVIGYEGLVGVDVLLGADSALNENLVQHANGALRINTAAIRGEFKRGGALHDSVLRFVRLMMIQVSQTALCNRLHTVEERLSRWLLLCRDRAGTNELQLTQEFLAIMLGTNRATVTMSAIALQSAGYIQYTRGHITVTDHEGLEDFTCECYQTVKTEYDRLLK
ncbi:MAG: Crp/Fnr family transcriptional regulator [Acidobacteria bacterium]|nr:Crp/Fnr family transcriptional regulator [Acidobacteriota bacterium]